MRKHKKKISALLLGAITTGTVLMNTITVTATGTSVIYPVHSDLTVGSGKEVTTIEREAALTKKTNFAISPLPQSNIIKIQNSSERNVEKQVGSTLVVCSDDSDGKITVNTVATGNFTEDFFEYVSFDKEDGRLGAKLTSPIKIESVDKLNGNTIQFQNLSMDSSKLYYLETIISGIKDGEDTDVITVYGMDKADYEEGIAELSVKSCSDVDEIKSMELTVVEFIPNEIEGATTPYIEVSAHDAEWIGKTGAYFDMESVASEHPRSITVPDSADTEGMAIPDVLTINYYFDGKVVFNGNIAVNKKEQAETKSEAVETKEEAPKTDILETISTGAISYDTDGDGIDDVLIDSRDIRKLAVWISEINRKWTKNYKDDDKGLLDNIRITQGQMEEYKKEVSQYEELVK